MHQNCVVAVNVIYIVQISQLNPTKGGVPEGSRSFQEQL